jgi:outer membrane lipoprotein-sorting protein
MRSTVRRLLPVVLAVCLLAGCVGVTHHRSPGELRSDVAATYEDVHAYAATVELQVDGPENRSVTYRVVHRDGATRVTYREPSSLSGTTVLTKGDVTVTYDPETECATYTQSATPPDVLGALVGMLGERTTYDGTDNIDGDDGFAVAYSVDDANVSLVVGGSPAAYRFRDARDGAASAKVWVDPSLDLPVKAESTVNRNGTTARVTLRVRDLTLNPSLDDEQFEVDALTGEHAPEPVSVQSREALAEKTTTPVPSPDVPSGYEFDRGRVLHSDGHESVELVYANGTRRLLVTASAPRREILPAGETVAVDGNRAILAVDGENRTVTWTCVGRTYSVSGTISREAVLAVARSIRCRPV